MYLLFPGRHQLLTNFQFNYIAELVSGGLESVKDISGKSIEIKDRLSAIIFAVTSANHSNTRRNPLPFYLRAIAIQEFARELGIPTYVYGIDDVGNLQNFASYTIKRIRHESEGMFDPTPGNTLVLCSTPVLEMYEQLNYSILPAELNNRKSWSYKVPLPWDIVERIATDENWSANESIVQNIHLSSLNIWKKYKLGEKVSLLFRDKMISDDGDITTTRDYNTYVRQMDEIAVLKYQDTASYVRPGRIGDIGCAVGSWIKLICADEKFRESDFYGIEVARHLFDICQQRKHNGEFINPFVFFSQRNAVTGLVFNRDSMNTIHTSSLTHEIESYGSRQELLQFMHNRYDELDHGGIWVNRDVVGPENKEEWVLMKLNRSDGRNDDVSKSFADREGLANYLRGLSTFGRFQRFSHDFRKKEGYKLAYEIVSRSNEEYIKIKLRDACEFMSRKDYVDNWESEMHETFCFWDFTEWKSNLEKIGFVVLPESRAYTNDWIVKNRLEGRVKLFRENSGDMELINYPVTNMILLAEKR